MKIVTRLSQCMIVKNEEKNIRRALSWGKGIVFEQIVVDTGSSDNTVEIAKEMGAKVFHFDWNDDFSAAKNFALEQAKGNWIAFLDADEYFSDEETKKLLPLLRRLDKTLSPTLRAVALNCTMANLDDSGGVINLFSQCRIFRNIPELRFKNRVHERLSLSADIKLTSLDASEELTIYHTGYAESVYEETGKIDRNITLLKRELEENISNGDTWSYLADSFYAANRLDEAEEACLKAIEREESSFDKNRKREDITKLIKIKYRKNSGQEEDIVSIYQVAKDYAGSTPDLEYWTGLWFYQRGERQKARHYLEQALNLLDQQKGDGKVAMVGNLAEIYQILFGICKAYGTPSDVIRYGVLALRMNPYLFPVLLDMLLLLKQEPGEEETAGATFGFLSKLYDLSSFKNKTFLIKVAEKVPFPALEKQIYPLMSKEEQEVFAGVGEIFG
ncbi:Glycosyltransferase involved in cell wall bisynthesis [Lacrimispora sphenoides]|uniref:glycosyltransferase family 2 protein n=1 Tax=Lacrimispora sphenoides TaxID=29370 RepID=UPI0008C64CA0|nr:glycosyltransferase family 2 protein [Lacrimispora sphenoides]SET94761.1 Glycosyltransferase involved in cell wall bisynthesis [Lacrimispora sphenoides]